MLEEGTVVRLEEDLSQSRDSLITTSVPQGEQGTESDGQLLLLVLEQGGCCGDQVVGWDRSGHDGEVKGGWLIKEREEKRGSDDEMMRCRCWQVHWGPSFTATLMLEWERAVHDVRHILDIGTFLCNRIP